MKSRQQLKNLFSTGNKPTQDDFADLIDSAINITDDGIGVGENGEPMELLQQGEKLRLLDFSSAKDNPVWRIGAQSGGVNGLNVATANERSRLFIKKENGNTGINNDNPQAKLHIIPDSGTTVRVDDLKKNPLLLIEADGSIGIGAGTQEAYRVSVGGTVNLKDDTTLDGALYANKGIVVNEGAVIKTGALEAKQGLKVDAGLVVATGALAAKQGMTVNDGLVVATGALEAQQGMTVNNGLVVSTGALEAQHGITANEGLVVETGNLQAKQGLTVNEGAVVNTGILAAKSGLQVDGGVVIGTGILTAKQGITVNDGLVVATGALTAKQGLTVTEGVVVQTGKTEVKAGLAVRGGATIETGLLTAAGGLSVTGGKTLNADGAVTLGNTTDGPVTINGALKANNGATVSGAALIAANGLNVTGDLTVSNDATLKKATVDTLLVEDITVSGNLGLQSVNLQALTAGNATVNDMRSGKLAVAGECEISDNVVFDSGMIYATYEGTAAVHPKVKLVKGTVAGELGHFTITVDDTKLVTVIYNDDSDIKNFILDWEDYRVAAPDKANGFQFIRIGNSSWDLQDQEYDLAAAGVYQETVIADNGLRILYTAAATGTPQFAIRPNEDPAIAGFTFAVDGELLTIYHPASQESCTVKRLLSDWETWFSNKLDAHGAFEIRQTSGMSGDLAVTAVSATALAINSAGAVFNKAKLKTNTVKVNGHLMFDGSDLLIGGVSGSETLAENAATILPTQKAVKTYVDNGLASKADQSTVTSQLAKKADKTTVTTELAKKVDTATLTTELAKKADTATLTTELAKKADTATLTTELAKKADTATLTTELAKKADTATLTTELAKKADTATLTTELAKKANQSAMVTALAAKAGLVQVDELAIATKATDTVKAVALSAASRGILLVRVITAAGVATAGLLAIHGTDSLLKIAGDSLSTQKDNAGTCNLYLDAGTIKVQNSLAEAVTISVSYFGV